MKNAESFPTILSGRRFSADEILYLQETVRVFHRLSWHELLQTICEHLDWVTPAGRYKVDSCAKALIKLEGLGPIEVDPVMDRGAMKLWNEYVERYHPLGYKRPFGAHQRYFIWSGSRHRLGCLLFASSAWALSVRDEWIGWSEADRAQRLNWVIANTRFLNCADSTTGSS